MRLSVQMKKILLTLLKAELNPEFFEGKVEIWHKKDLKMLAKIMRGEIGSGEMVKKTVPQMTKDSLLMVIKPSAITVRQLPNKKHVYIHGSVDFSFSRSLRRLVKLGLVDVLKEVSPGRHGHLYSLSEKGRMEAHKIRNEILNILNEFQHLL
ncbi:MAG: hypothetical protein QXN36_05705 [Candidatus Bathyarchaeia archaeon]